jgi:hypothetical protein
MTLSSLFKTSKEEVMSNNISNSSIKREQIKDSVQNLEKTSCRSTKKQKKEITGFNVESTQSENEDYSEINIASFKQSFFKLQRNYNVGNLN